MSVKQRLELRMRRRHYEFQDGVKRRERIAIAFQPTHDAFREVFSRMCRGAI